MFLELVVTEGQLEKLEGRGYVVDKESSESYDMGLKEFPIYFTLTTDGRIVDVLANKFETKSILNIKRGILTSLQTKLLLGGNEGLFWMMMLCRKETKECPI